MAAKQVQALSSTDAENILAVVGAGHVNGIKRYIDNYRHFNSEKIEGILENLNKMPEKRKLSKLVSIFVAAIIITVVALGFDKTVLLAGQRLEIGF